MLGDFVFPEMIILGSTGSIGEQALDVARAHHIGVRALSARQNAERVERQAREFGVAAAAMADESAARDLQVRLADTSVRVYAGSNGICEMLSDMRDTAKEQVVQNAIMGRAGLEPTLCSLQNKYRLALANKESLVVAGSIVMKTAAEYGAQIIPVDSEHSAIFQCLQAGKKSEVASLLLTASGGPFYGKKRAELLHMNAQDALKHPTWKMGAKITVDSASMMNKGFEVMEASHLFGIPAEKIQVLIHRESIVHSMVEFCDHAVIAELSVPDMRECIQYAMTYPHRVPSLLSRLDLTALSGLTFSKPDDETFPLLQCAKQAMTRGGGFPAALNAANEIAVEAFLAGRIGFCGMMDAVQAAFAAVPSAAAGADRLEDVLQWDEQGRLLARKIIESE